MTTNTAPCPQCGAVFPTGETCSARFDRCQLAELETPDRYAVHHLSVPCYLLQHNAYSARGWLEVRALLARFVRAGWTPAMARRQARVSAASGQRDWSFTRGPKLAGVETLVWTRTLADVRLDPPEAYCADVRRWAASLLDDTDAFIQNLPPSAA